MVDWQDNPEVLRLMRRDVKRELRALPGRSEDELNELALRIVEMARYQAHP